MHPVVIIVLSITFIYLVLMLIYFIKRKMSGKNITDTECDMCKDRGKKLIKYYYKQKRKEEKLLLKK